MESAFKNLVFLVNPWQWECYEIYTLKKKLYLTALVVSISDSKVSGLSYGTFIPENIMTSILEHTAGEMGLCPELSKMIFILK